MTDKWPMWHFGWAIGWFGVMVGINLTAFVIGVAVQPNFAAISIGPISIILSSDDVTKAMHHSHS